MTIPFFTLSSGMATIALQVASEPVPQVVGRNTVLICLWANAGSRRRSFMECVHYAATADGDDHVTLQVFNGLDYVLNIQIAGLPLNIRVQVIRSTVQLLQYAGA